ncbi:acyltransferase family protein, partial [Vibrio amylolyticus]
MFRDNVHNLRAIAIILVVLTHVISAVSSNGDVSVILLRSLSQNASVLFTIIAGYLFFELNQTFVYKRFIAKKLKNSVIPYVICSIPAILIYTLSLKTSHVWIDMEWFHSISMIEQIGFMLVSGGHLGPYWFIPVILMMYFISPVLYRISYSRHVVIWLVVLSAIAIYVGRPSLNSNVIHSLIYFIPVFLFGQYLSQTKIHEKIARVNTFVFSLFVGVTLVITYLSFQYSHNMDFPLKIALLFFLFSLTYRLL